MKILIIGGTGKTGKELISQSLSIGHLVSVLVRKPNKLKIADPKLKVFKGDVLKPETLSDAFKDQDAVLCALGHKKFIFKSSILSKGTRNIIACMNKNHIKRFICITSLGINDSKYRLGLYYSLFTIPFILYFYFKDKSKQEKLIMHSDLDWTIIRPGQLYDGKLNLDHYHGQDAGHYILTKFISRATVAHFMLYELVHNDYLYKTTGITN